MQRKYLFIGLSGLLFAIVMSFGCSDSGSNPPSSDTQLSAASQSYYNFLAAGKFTDRTEAQPQFPASGELFKENASIFRLSPAKITAKQAGTASSLLSDFALYTPTSASYSKRVGLTVSDPPSNFTSGIPGIKKSDIIPAACSGLLSDALRDCLDDLGVSSAPESDHVSQHDLQSLRTQIGADIEGKILNKSFQSLAAQISSNDRAALINQLSDFTNDDPAHASLDMASFSPFDSTGYAFSSVVVTDNSSSDANGDGVLEPHSTMITELVKPVSYQRSTSLTLDACMVKYRGSTIDDRYVVKLTSYTHLDHLKTQRKLPAAVVENAAGEEILQYESVLDVMGVNQALDANLIKAIYSSSELLSASSTEYSLMFMLAPDLMNGAYSDLLASITNANDNGCQELVEQHINARTAMMSGASSSSNTLQKTAAPALTVFYQVPVVFSRQLTAKFTDAILGEAILSDDKAPLQDYCMVDGNGDKVAIVDPLSGALVPACEKFDQKSLAKTVMLTKDGACKGLKSELWAYEVGLVRSPRFGRGVQYILTEWLIHNQVGDYKNIHAYQSLWKAGFQVAVRAAKIVAATYFQEQLTASRFATAAAPDILFLLDAVMGYTAKVLKYADFEIAKHHIKFNNNVIHFLAEKTGRAANDTSSKRAGYAAFAAKLATNSKYSVTKGNFLGFAIERFTDSVAQAIDVEVVGWQDLSDGSHHGCFKFD